MQKPKVLVGLLCVSGAVVCLWFAVRFRPDFAMAFALFGVGAFLVSGAYASFFRPQNWNRLFSSGPTGQSPGNLRELIQNKGFAIASWVYLVTAGVYGLLIAIFGVRQFTLALVGMFPFAAMGTIVFVWSGVLKVRALREQRKREESLHAS